MDFIKWLVQDVLSDSITWLAAVAILTSWAFGVADIIKYGWSPKEDAE